MTLQELIGSMDCSLLKGSLQIQISHLTENSREVRPGSLFFCRKGMHTDGIRYLSEAIRRGAAAVICTDISEEAFALLMEQECCVVSVKNMEEAMQKAAAGFYGYPEHSITLIGVTGTKGKTTVSTLLYRLIRAMKRRVLLVGTNGVEIDGIHIESSHTTPPVLELYGYLGKARDADCRYAVLEVSSLAVKQGRLGALRFDLGIFTNLYPDHIGIGEHADMEEYRNWKKAFLQRCRVCVLNQDDPWGRQLKKELLSPTVTYSLKEAADYTASRIVYRISSDFWGCEYEMGGGFTGNIRLAMPGSFNVSNSLAAAAAADCLGVSFDLVQTVFEKADVKGRCQVAGIYCGAYVIVDYAHNESSMRAVLSMAREYHPSRVICMFGCGGERSRIRRFGMGQVSASMADLTVVTQDNSRGEPFSGILSDILEGVNREHGRYITVPDRYEAIRFCLQTAQPGDFIFLMGKGHEQYQEIGGVKTPFSDVQAVKKILSEMADTRRNEE